MIRLSYTILNVFTSTLFLGNPLAIVRVPKELREEITQSRKQTIAREFNLSETVFLHEGNTDEPLEIDIFTTDAELPFAGHPTIGTGWYFLSQNQVRDTVNLRTKAGDIPVTRGSKRGTVKLCVPTDFKIHPSHPQPRTKSLQLSLVASDYVNGFDEVEPVASIVKGMTFLLLEVSSEDALGRLQPTPERPSVPGLGEWGGFVSLYAFYEREDGVVRTRMFDRTLEDPATGSAASTLCGWLAKTRRGEGKHTFNIVQGVEIGRKSEIEVTVEIRKDGEIEKIELGGAAVEVMEGSLVAF